MGTLDSRRAQRVIESLTDGIARRRTKIAILDVTGVIEVDAQAAGALVQAARAAKLLGARVLLTGIRPEMARSLIALGADLSSVGIQSSLQRGIELAMSSC
jgi:rsbT co-antagonist protein RsbR